MRISLSTGLVVGLMLLAGILAGCRREQPSGVPPSFGTDTPAATATELALQPLPGTEIQLPLTEVALPSPTAPATEAVFEPAASPTATQLSAYPGPTASPNPYAGPERSTNPTASPAQPSPTAPLAQPTATSAAVAGDAYPGPTASPDPYAGPGQSAPTPRPTSTPLLAVSPTATPILAVSPTATLLVAASPTGAAASTPTPAASFTPTPTRTATPTPTPSATPTRIPPTVNFSLRATDPETVERAAGKVQLFEYFAFWDLDSLGMTDEMNQLEADYGQQVNFVYLDIDNPANDELRLELGLRIPPRRPPYFFLLDPQGQVIGQWQGPVSKDVLERALLGAITTPTPVRTPTRTPTPQ